jgi:glycosyltransferase involved in cell wall biosynthesis
LIDLEYSPFISIIIPVFNRQDLVEECIRSILAQTENDWEAIIVDDGSTDQTWQVLEKFYKQDKRIRIYTREGEPKGANRCRNQGIAASKGKYLFFLDSDDLLGPDFVFNRKKYASLHPDVNMLVFPEASFKGDLSKFYFRQILCRQDDEDDLYRFLQRDSPWITSGPIIKKSVFNEVVSFNEFLMSGQDWDLFIRILITGIQYKKIISLETPDFFHRMDENYNSIFNSFSVKNWFINKKKGLMALLPLFKNRGFFQKTNPYRKAILEYYMLICMKNASIDRNNDSLSLWSIFRQKNIISFMEWFIWAVYLHPLMYRRGRIKEWYLTLVTTFFPKWNYIRLAMEKINI